MSDVWKSSADAVKDLRRISDFGGPNEEDWKLDLTNGTGNHKEKAPCRFVDPRTGEEIDVRSECRLVESDRRSKHRSIGRGKLIEEFRHSSKVQRLQKQLRMNRPLGFGNNMIESYFTNSTEAEEPLPTTSDRLKSPVRTNGVKGKRRNVLISCLLEKKANGERNEGDGSSKNDVLPVSAGKKSSYSRKIREGCRAGKECAEGCSCTSSVNICLDFPDSYIKHSPSETMDDKRQFTISQPSLV